MVLSLFVKIVILQAGVIAVIIFVLKRILDKKLVESAINEFRVWQREGREQLGNQVLIVSPKGLKLKYKLRILKIALDYFGDDAHPSFKINKDLLGGIIIKIGDNIIECSLKDRLAQVFSR